MTKKNSTRNDLTIKVHNNLGISKNISSKIIDFFFENIIFELEKLNKIKISSFGTFVILHKKERTGRNPKTKEIAKIIARKVVKFKPSDSFKNKINLK